MREILGSGSAWDYLSFWQDNAEVAVNAIGFAVVCLIVWLGMLWRDRRRRKRPLPHVKVSRGWEPTGNINFVVPENHRNDPAVFLLEVEEDREVELLGGGTSREIRFRLATIEEAKTVVQAYAAGDIKTKKPPPVS